MLLQKCLSFGLSYRNERKFICAALEIKTIEIRWILREIWDYRRYEHKQVSVYLWARLYWPFSWSEWRLRITSLDLLIVVGRMTVTLDLLEVVFALFQAIFPFNTFLVQLLDSFTDRLLARRSRRLKNQWMNEWKKKWMNEWINGLINEWVNE